LAEIRPPETKLEPRRLVTDWPVTHSPQALRILGLDRQLWPVEDSSSARNRWGGTKYSCWAYAGRPGLGSGTFLYQMGVTLEWPEVQWLARLGGREGRKGRLPGKIVLRRGLRRLADTFAMLDFLKRYIHKHGALPPRIAVLIGILPTAE